ncbi:acetylglutamate kinase [Actinomyces sp. B33]|uniref:acetylglutamate kinase n=1 Tax=Actinomyces sp. B33 TaxID=2942131 RepID=UPI00233F9703|nr:acetylglutamate kinase [Actinomyces sp. B33]MDC4233696.1 acetylglutamate kinase [Actinomyces sp. B33]
MSDHTSALSAAERAHVLGQALTWMREFRGEIIVIKYGGHAMTDPQAQRAFATDIQFLYHAGLFPVIVHGGGPQVTAMLSRLGIDTPFVDGVRVTTPEAMDVVRMVLTGSVQRRLISLLNESDSLAVGISGEDGALLRARRRTGRAADGRLVDFGLVGDVEAVDPDPIVELLAAGRIPVISSIALDADDPSSVLNINADAAASAIAVALGAAKLLMLTDVEGVYADYPDPDSLVRSATASQIRALAPAISTGMIPKIEACLEAIDAGVEAVHIVDGRQSHSVLVEVMTDDGTGTMIVPDPPDARASTTPDRKD